MKDLGDVKKEPIPSEEKGHVLELEEGLNRYEVIERDSTPKTLKELQKRLEDMCDDYENFTLKDVKEMKMILMSIISEDEDVTNEEYEAYQMISYLTDRISSKSVNYLVIGDGIGGAKKDDSKVVIEEKDDEKQCKNM